MLVSNTEKSGSIIGLRLVTGEEILAKFVNFDKNNMVYVIHRPFTLASDGQGSIGLVPGSMIADPEKDMEINAATVVSKFSPKLEFIENYKSAISSIAVPSHKIIT